MIWKLALNAVLGMKRIFNIIIEATATITFWWTHVLRILTVNYTFNTFITGTDVVSILYSGGKLLVFNVRSPWKSKSDCNADNLKYT